MRADSYSTSDHHRSRRAFAVALGAIVIAMWALSGHAAHVRAQDPRPRLIAVPSSLTIQTFDARLPAATEMQELADERVTVANGATDLLAALAPDASAEQVRTLAASIEGGALAVRAHDNARRSAHFTLPVPKIDDAKAPVGQFFALRMRLWATVAATTEDTAEVSLRIWARSLDRDAVARPCTISRKIDLNVGALRQADQFVAVTVPLASWRWAAGTVGDWKRITHFTVQLPRGALLFFDELALVAPYEPAAGEPRSIGCVPTTNDAWSGLAVQRALFTPPGAPGRFVMEPSDGYASILDYDPTELAGIDHEISVGRHFRVYTDVTADKLTNDAALALVTRLDRLAHFVVRVFKVGQLVMPALPTVPPVLLIYSTYEAMLSFVARLAEHWNAGASPTEADGYAVQEFACCSWKPELGWQRPTFFHEAIHAALPLWTGLAVERARWLHEGIANYLQICVYPDSLPRSTYIQQFEVGVTEESFFRPLAAITGDDVPHSHYAQLATLVAFLMDKHPDWMGPLVRSLVAGENVARFLADNGTSITDLQAAWLAWGRARFAPGSGDDGPCFEVPVEWR